MAVFCMAGYQPGVGVSREHKLNCTPRQQEEGILWEAEGVLWGNVSVEQTQGILLVG